MQMKQILIILCGVLGLACLMNACSRKPSNESKAEAMSTEYYLSLKDELDALFGEHELVDLNNRDSQYGWGTIQLAKHYSSFTIAYEDANDGKTYQFSSEIQDEINKDEGNFSFSLNQHFIDRIGNLVETWDEVFPVQDRMRSMIQVSYGVLRKETFTIAPVLIDAGVDFSHFDPSQLLKCKDPNLYIDLSIRTHDDENHGYGTQEEILQKCVDTVTRISSDTQLPCSVSFKIVQREKDPQYPNRDIYRSFETKGNINFLEETNAYEVVITEAERP